MSIIFSLIFLLIVALGAYRGYKRAKKKGMAYSITSFAVILLSALISIVIARAIAAKVSVALYKALADGMLPEGITDLFSDLPSAPAIILALVAMIISPVIFYPVNSVITLILKILAPIVTKLTLAVIGGKKKSSVENDAAAEPEKEEFAATEPTAEDSEAELADAEKISEDGEQGEAKKRKKPRRTRSAESRASIRGRVSIAFGILAGILSVFIFFAPILAGLGIVGMIEQTVSDADIAELEELSPAMDVAHDLTHNAAISVTNAIGGKLMFNALTTFKVNGESITLYNEAELLCGVAKTALGVYSEEKTPEEKAAALDDIPALLERSSIIPILASEFLAGAASAWERGEAFCGISMPTDGSDPTADVLVEAISLFSDSTTDTVKEDVGTLVKIAAVIVRNDLINNMPEDPMDLLANRTLVSDLFFEVLENARLKALVGSLVDTGIEIMTGALSVPETLDGLHEDFLSQLGAISAESEQELKSALGDVFKRYGIDITDNALSGFTSSVIANGGTSVTTLTKTQLEALLTSIEINGAEGTAKADLSADAGFRAATVLVSTEYIESVHGTAEADSRAEANALAEVFASLSTVTDLFSGADAGISSTVKSLGSILDKLAACNTIGKRCVDTLVVALLQTDAVYDTVHMDKVSSTHFANSIIAGAEGGSYSAMMNSIAGVIDAMTKSGSAEGLNKTDVESVISTLTPETAEALSHLVSDNLVSSMGFGEGTSTGVNKIITSVFNNIADAKKNDMDDETYAEESKKIAEIIDVTMTISEGEGEVDIDSYVDSVMSSTILTDSICDVVYGEGDVPTTNPLNTDMELSESNKTALVQNLQSKIDAADASDKAKTERDAVAVAAYMNVEIVIVGGVVTLA